MKKTILFLLLLGVFSCSSDKPYYETPIKIWLDKNLNDISSYEPVEFIIVDSTNFMKLNSNIGANGSALRNVIQRKMDQISSIINLVNDSALKKDLIQNRKIILKKNNGDIIDLPTLLILDNNINNDLKSIDKMPIEQIAMIEGVNNRIETTIKQIENELAKIGTSSNSLPNQLQNGQFIYHKFRAKNSLGAYVLSEMLFKLDNNKTIVEKAEKIE